MPKTVAEEDPMLPPGSNYCQCAACLRYFRSVSGFDMHRVGETEDRRCLTTAEMQARGMSQNARGYWITKAFDREMSAEAAVL